jgi:hypothetical protein
MMGVTVVDVFLRWLGWGVPRAYEILALGMRMLIHWRCPRENVRLARRWVRFRRIGCPSSTLAVLRSGLNAISAPPFAHDIAIGAILFAVAKLDGPYFARRMTELPF